MGCSTACSVPAVVVATVVVIRAAQRVRQLLLAGHLLQAAVASQRVEHPQQLPAVQQPHHVVVNQHAVLQRLASQHAELQLLAVVLHLRQRAVQLPNQAVDVRLPHHRAAAVAEACLLDCSARKVAAVAVVMPQLHAASQLVVLPRLAAVSQHVPHLRQLAVQPQLQAVDALLLHQAADVKLLHHVAAAAVADCSPSCSVAVVEVADVTLQHHAVALQNQPADVLHLHHRVVVSQLAGLQLLAGASQLVVHLQPHLADVTPQVAVQQLQPVELPL